MSLFYKYQKYFSVLHHSQIPLLDLLLTLICSLSIGKELCTSLFDKRDDTNFHITNFPFMPQRIRYTRACSSYECFILRAVRISNKLIGQGYVIERLDPSVRKVYCRYGELVKQYAVPVSRLLHKILGDDHIQLYVSGLYLKKNKDDTYLLLDRKFLKDRSKLIRNKA